METKICKIVNILHTHTHTHTHTSTRYRQVKNKINIYLSLAKEVSS